HSVRRGPQRNRIGIVRPNALHEDLSPGHAMMLVLGRGSGPASSKASINGTAARRFRRRRRLPSLWDLRRPQLLRRPSAVRFHCVTLSAIMRVDFMAAWLSWA